MSDPRRAPTPEQREALVIGHAPRIPPLQPEELSDELLRLVARMITINRAVNAREPEHLEELVAKQDAGASSEQIAKQLTSLPEIMRVMLRHPELFARQAELGIQLLSQGALDPRDRELAILRIGWLCQAPYEWGEHVLIAKGLGISSDEIEHITQGASAPGWNERERAILEAVDELHGGAMISDPTWATLAKWLDEKQLIELPIVVGQYQTVAYYQNSLRLQLHSGNAGLKSR